MRQESEAMKKALITGITGQDGAYLAEFLLEKGFIDTIVHRKDLKATLVHLIDFFGYSKGSPIEDPASPSG